MSDGKELGDTPTPIGSFDVSHHNRWALVAEAHATFGAVAARELAESLGMVMHGQSDGEAMDF